MSKISDQLFTLYKNKTVPPFILLKGNKESLTKSVNEFLMNIFINEKNISKIEAKKKLELGHQDIMQLNPTTNKNYSVK